MNSKTAAHGGRVINMSYVNMHAQSVLWSSIEKHIEPSLSRKFSIANDEQCRRLTKIVGDFIHHCCEQFDPMILNLAASLADGKNFSDWRSFYIERMKSILDRTVDKFHDEVYRLEGMGTQHVLRVECHAGVRHISKIRSAYIDAFNSISTEEEDKKIKSRPNIVKREKRKRVLGRIYLLEFIPCSCQ